MPAPHTAATRQLKRRLGARVDTSRDACWAASFDSSKISFLPVAVISPRAEADVGVVLTLANKYRVPVTVRGRGTTLMGSAAPVRGGWVVDMLQLNKIAIDADAGMAHVGAGATTLKIQQAAAAQGWFYPPDPSSKEYCTIGGNIACNAGGMHGGKYGVTRDFIIALRGFLPTGEFVEWGTATKKFAAGFNLRDLWIGSEGMLGIVTGAVLKLVPQPATRWTLLTSFTDEVAALTAAKGLFRARVQPGKGAMHVKPRPAFGFVAQAAVGRQQGSRRAHPDDLHRRPLDHRGRGGPTGRGRWLHQMTDIVQDRHMLFGFIDRIQRAGTGNAVLFQPVGNLKSTDGAPGGGIEHAIHREARAGVQPRVQGQLQIAHEGTRAARAQNGLPHESQSLLNMPREQALLPCPGNLRIASA